ncbi:type II toxin-antitoxin system Phd/YefM family antitoxin [Tardiphaga sp. vice352]|uniref:type II toxin-antitoxin system Phd/YefM family antitoxin n=1 Tax=unclassified Tardiphaga TaxID=2631404 RepID=UPI001161D78A|nr:MULTISPECIES: type II toxin-antitoxin system Phd/YefM family antitoxin [unclassified Tardiphaga]MBC7584369.1 type II toxin-antitoxin system Phd/YefM family antitoxin [Tardiphaga sp.]QDM16516.1 type II toxin-antitoxin system Phd/YefM family antitoxin [Tardiphaga sp. vice278]QDM21541.1 type II toxin-antitoxin system Phd/YefM family antitoxin [Tardiphaga sp. vice154]QDM26726.1 type II toxin-antitoxin system Phd/YefM family antitoxin [Tardiphaga sp. vice304]QDM31790.1 type II toxin-antitoxin sy
MKHVTVTEAEAQLDKLVAEVEQTGDEVVITRDGAPVARLVREEAHSQSDVLTAEQIERRRQAGLNLREIGKRLNVGATQEEIKSWIEEGRR